MFRQKPNWPSLLKRLWSWAQRLCARKHLSRTDGDDAVGDAMLDLVVRSRSSRRKGSWVALASKILERKLVRLCSRKAPTDLDLSSLASPAVEEEPSYEPVDDEVVHSRIASLTGGVERMVATGVLAGETLVEIAERSGRSLRSVKKACERAIATLEKRRMLDTQGS